MSEATPMPVEPPGPSTERLAAWRALIERIRQGDRAEVLAWDEGPAAGPGATYQVLVTRRVRQRLRGAPPLLAGSVAGIVAVLRVDPTEASMIFRRRRLGDGGWVVTFGAAGGHRGRPSVACWPAGMLVAPDKWSTSCSAGVGSAPG
jgi:hypothetical protein